MYSCLFPYFFKCYGESIAAEIASTSEIVGMEIPGLHSLFLSIKGMIHKKESNPFYKILNCSRFGVMQLFMKGQYLKCEIDAFYSKNVKSAMRLGQARGSLILAAAQANISVHEFAPRKVKMSVCGNGAASKEQVSYMVTQILKLNEPPKPMDITDAMAVGICYLNQTKFL